MTGKFYSFDKLNEIAQGDNAFVQEMIISFIDTISEAVNDMQKLMNDGEWKTIGGIAHKLASNYAYMDAESLYVLAANIEKKIQNSYDLVEITAMTRRLCADSLFLIDELKKHTDK